MATRKVAAVRAAEIETVAGEVTKGDVVRKITSRKFWVCVAAFLGSVGASIAGITTDNQTVAVIGTVCAVLSAAIYAAAEAAVDTQRAKEGK